MAGNTFGTLFRFTSWGESHGPAIGVVVDGVPSRIPLAEADIQHRFGVTPPSVHQMILTLERAGLIRRQPRASRSIEVLVPPEQLPVLEMPDQPVKTSVPRY